MSWWPHLRSSFYMYRLGSRVKDNNTCTLMFIVLSCIQNRKDCFKPKSEPVRVCQMDILVKFPEYIYNPMVELSRNAHSQVNFRRMM